MYEFMYEIFRNPDSDPGGPWCITPNQDGGITAINCAYHTAQFCSGMFILADYTRKLNQLFMYNLSDSEMISKNII